MEIRHFNIQGLEVRAADDNARPHLEGYASVYDANSYTMDHERYGEFIERVSPTAFVRSLNAAVAGDSIIHALWSHDQSQPLGSTRGGKLSLASDERGLGFRLDTTRFTPAQLDAARDGDVQMSFGFAVRHDEWDFPADGPAIRTLVDVDLFEISPVVSPAYPDSSAALRSLTEARSKIEKTEEIVEPAVENEATEQFNNVRIALLKRWADSVLSKPV